MKIKMKMFLSLAFVLSYATFLSLGFECLLNLLGTSMAISLDGAAITKQYPRFIPFCLLAGLLSLVAIIVIFILHTKLSERFEFSKKLWRTQIIIAAVLSVPMVKLWETLFDLLHKAL